MQSTNSEMTYTKNMKDRDKDLFKISKKGKCLFGAALLAAALLPAAFPSSAYAASEVDARLAEIARSYEKGAAGEKRPDILLPDPRNISDDKLIASGDWTALAYKYDNGMLKHDIANAPSPSRLAGWWNSLGDPTLTDLIYSALTNNRDLTSSRAKVAEARAALGISKAAVLPWLDASGSWTNADTSENSTQAGSSYNLYRLGIDASWEIDIFGGRRESIKASEADLAATHAALHNAWVTLAAEVALNYVNLCTLHERLDIANQNLALQSDTLELLQSQFDSGLTDALALNQAKYTVEQTRSSIPPLRSSLEETMNALAILTGQVPGSLEAMLIEQKPIPKPDPINLVGIPAEALRRRPDIRAAEMQFVAQVARTKSARADLYPKFSLIGSIGLESLSTGSILKGSSFGFSFGPSITWPIFHGGAIRRNIEVQGAREEQLLAAYEQTVLSAVAEVRNALASETQERERNNSLASGVEAARAAVFVAEDKYRNGLSDFNNVIGAQSALLSLQDQFVVSQGQMTSNIIQIFKALGGGWQPMVLEDLNPTGVPRNGEEKE